MQSEVSQQLSYLMTDSISLVLQSAFAKLYQQKPDFPITYLTKLLHKHCRAQQIQTELQKNRKLKIDRYNILCNEIKDKQNRIAKQIQQQRNKHSQNQNIYYRKLEQTQYLQDLLIQWLPNYLCQIHKLQGCYIAHLNYHYRELQMNNWQNDGHFDKSTPKILLYIGACQSHKSLMIGRYLPNDCGKSYEVLIEQQQEQQQKGEEEQNNNDLIESKKKVKYLYIHNAIKDEKIFYFKYPKLGSYVCYPLKIKNYLKAESLNKGIADYKQYLKSKKQAQDQYSQKVSELHTEMQDAKKKVQDFELNEQNASQKEELEQQFRQISKNYNELVEKPVQVMEPIFQSDQQAYIIGCDTLGSDKDIEQKVLSEIAVKVQYLQNLWQKKEKLMLLMDIKSQLQEQSSLSSMETYLNDYQRTIVQSIEPQIKQKYPNNDKQTEFEFSALKTQKMFAIFSESVCRHSLQVYIRSYVPKYKQVIQIALMLLKKPKQQINIAKTNILDHRKCLRMETIEKMMQQLGSYSLHINSSEQVLEQYKIQKLLQRLDKIDLEQVGHYNLWLQALCQFLKFICWSRIYGRDAKVEFHENRVKDKQMKQLEIEKWSQNLQKALESHKSQLLANKQQAQQDEEILKNFNEEEWNNNYLNDNPKPQRIEVEELLLFLDID